MALPCRPRFRLRRKHAWQACFRHSASIANARSGGGHFASAPLRRGSRKAGLSRRCGGPLRWDSDARLAGWQWCGTGNPGYARQAKALARHHASSRPSSTARGLCSDEAHAGPSVRRSRPGRLPGHAGEDQGGGASASDAHAAFRTLAVRRRDSRHCRIPDFLKRALHPRPRLVWV